MAEPDNSPPDISDILARYREDEKPAGDISDILSRYAGAKKTETGWMPTWLKHGLVGGAADLLSQASMSDPATMGNAITSEQAQHELESFTGPAPQPEGFLGRGAADVVRAATHPASWIGPGGPAAKAAFLTASGYGGEAGGTLAEKAGLSPAGQTVARVAGSLTPAGAAGLVGAVRAPRVRAAQAAADQAAAANQTTAANQAAAQEFNIRMSRGKASGDLDAIREEDLASRGAYGKPAQDVAAPHFEGEFQDFQNANRDIGEEFARGYITPESPREAAARINAELGEQGAQARAAVQAAQAAAEREAAAARGMVDDQGRALSSVIAEGRPPIENPREAGEIVGHAVRSAAARSRANYQGLYDEALGLPGLFRAEAFDGIGTRIQDRLMRGNNPVPIDDVTTPIASRTIRNLENISNLRFQNRADSASVPPFGAPHPDSVVAVDLRGVDQARKQLVAYYRSARSSPNASDARAVGRLIDEFDNEIERAISNGLFVGDPRALDAIQQARAAYSSYARQFRPQQAGDDVGTAMRRIIDRNATPEEIANMIVGSGRIGDRGLPVRLAGRLEEVLGRNTEAWSSIREVIWQKASRVRGEAGGVNTQGIDDLVGSSLGRRLFNPDVLDAMRAHSTGVRTLKQTIANLDATRNVKRVQDEYQRVFSGQDIGGHPGRVFRRIIDGTATPEETVQAVFSAISGDPGNATRIIGAIENIVGRDSETMALVRYGVWQKLTQNAATKDQPGYQKVAQAIGEFIHGKGGSVAASLYTPENIDLMTRYQDVVKRLVIPKYARTNSDTAPAMLKALREYGAAITAALGHAVDKAVGKVAGSAVKAMIRESANVVGNTRARVKVARSLSPIDLPPPTSTPGSKPATEASPLIKTLSRSLATRGGYARGGRTDKPSKAQAHYRLGSRRKRCDICTMFRAPHTCTAIVGKVSKIGLCDLFERKRAYAEGGEVTDTDDKLLPPPYLQEPQSKAGPALGEMAAQPFRDMAKGLGGSMTEDEAKDYAFWGLLGAIPPAKGIAAAAAIAPGLRRGVAGLAQAAPERIVGSAYKVGDQVFQGPIHVIAQENAMKALGLKEPIDLINRQAGAGLSERLRAHNAADGFMTSTGRFVDRKEAEAIANAGGQLPAGKGGRLGGMNAEDIGLSPVARALREAVAEVSPGIRAFHSSPHDFDRFDFSKIGTGEGAQVYGHGGYFAESPAVSGQGGEYWKQFLPRFSGPEREIAERLQSTKFNRKPIADTMDEELAWLEFNAKNSLTPQATAKNVQRLDEMRRVREALETGKPVGPRTYEVNINTRPEEFLNWDRPLAEQSMRERLPEIAYKQRDVSPDALAFYRLMESGYDKADRASGGISGGDFYKGLANPHTRDRAQVSNVLREAGVPGIRYLDQGSRKTAQLDARIGVLRQDLASGRGDHRLMLNQLESLLNERAMYGDPTSNYVMFPGTEGLIDIRKKYVLPAATAGGLGALAQQDEAGFPSAYAEGGEVDDDELLPPPYLREPQSRAGPALGEMAAQPFRDMAKGLGSGMTEDEAKNYFMEAMAGLVPMGRAAKPAARALREAVAEVAPGAAGLARTAPEAAPRALFDYSRIGEVPDVPQFDLPRYNPKHGVSDRVADLVANKKVRQQVMDYMERGHQAGAGTFYGTQPLREAFVEELGRKEGPDAFRRYMEFVGGSSPRSTVPENARNASYYYVLDRQGQPMPVVGSKNEQPYGHLAQRLHQRNAQTIVGPGWDVLKNPKPPSFIEDLVGNWQPVAVDAHAFKLPAMVSKDPRFLAGSMVLEKGGPTINPSELYQSGDLTMKQALKRPAFWAGKPNANEYAAMENYWKGMARELGYPAPAYGQASGWSGGGELTGLKSVSAEPFLRAVENRAILTAAERGLTPVEALSQFMRGKAPLLSGTGAAGLGALAQRDRHDE